MSKKIGKSTAHWLWWSLPNYGPNNTQTLYITITTIWIYENTDYYKLEDKVCNTLLSQPVTPLCLNRDPSENVRPGRIRTGLGNIHIPYLVNPSFSRRVCCSIWPNFKMSKKCLPLFFFVPKNFFFAAPLLALIWRWQRYEWKQNVAEYISVCGTLCYLSQSEQV